jgi:hypothetical protein
MARNNNRFSRKNYTIIAIFTISRKLNFSDNHDNRKEIIAISRFALGPSTALCSFCGLCLLWRSASSTALYPLYGPLLCPLSGPLSLYGPLFSLSPSVSSTAIFPPLKPYVPSLALCPPPRYYVLSMALCPLEGFCLLYSCPLYGPLSPLGPSVHSTAFCSLHGPLSSLRPSIHSILFLYSLNRPLYRLRLYGCGTAQ